MRDRSGHHPLRPEVSLNGSSTTEPARGGLSFGLNGHNPSDQAACGLSHTS